MGRFAILELRFTNKLASGCHNLRGASDNIPRLKAQSRPGALALAVTMDANDASRRSTPRR